MLNCAFDDTKKESGTHCQSLLLKRNLAKGQTYCPLKNIGKKTNNFKNEKWPLLFVILPTFDSFILFDNTTSDFDDSISLHYRNIQGEMAAVWLGVHQLDRHTRLKTNINWLCWMVRGEKNCWWRSLDLNRRRYVVMITFPLFDNPCRRFHQTLPNLGLTSGLRTS